MSLQKSRKAGGRSILASPKARKHKLIFRPDQGTFFPKDPPISVSEARRIFERALKANPGMAGNLAAVVASVAIVKAYECR